MITPRREDLGSSACKQPIVNKSSQCGQELKGKYHKAQIVPLVQEVSVYVDAVWLAQVFRNQGSDTGKVHLFQRVLVLDVS